MLIRKSERLFLRLLFSFSHPPRSFYDENLQLFCENLLPSILHGNKKSYRIEMF